MGGGTSKPKASTTSGEAPAVGAVRKPNSLKKMDSVYVNKAHLKHTHEMQDAHLYNEKMIEDLHHPMAEGTASGAAGVRPPYGEEPLAPSPDAGMYSPGSTRRGSLGSSYEPDQELAAERLATEATDSGVQTKAAAAVALAEEASTPVEAASTP